MLHRGCVTLVVLPLAGCATAYVPGSLIERDNIYDVRKVGCLEVGLRPLRDPVLAFTLANTCHYPVGVELRNLRVRAWSSDGIEYLPAIDDPRHELFEAAIDAHAEVNVAADFPVPVSTPAFCVDVARLNVDQPSPVPVEMCFHTEDGAVRPAALSTIEKENRESRPALMTQEQVAEEARALVGSLELGQ
jgi:hypothetical protein